MGTYETEALREKRYQTLVEQIKELEPDVIGIQEANLLPDYAERLAGDLDMDYIQHIGVSGVRLGPIGLPTNLREGDALLAKKHLGLKFAGRKQLSGGYVGAHASFHFEDATQILAGSIELNGSKVYVFVTHWHSSLALIGRAHV